MGSLNTIAKWLKKQHVLTYCAGAGESLWCANAFYIYDEDEVALYFLSDTTTRHGQLLGQQATTAGTINGQPKTVALIRGIQFRGEIRLLSAEASVTPRARYNKRFPIAKTMSTPIWVIRLDELKMTDNTLGFGKKIDWIRSK